MQVTLEKLQAVNKPRVLNRMNKSCIPGVLKFRQENASNVLRTPFMPPGWVKGLGMYSFRGYSK